MSLFSHVESGDRALVIDIGSASVGAAIVHFSKNKAPHILYSKRIPISIGEKPSGEKLLEKIYSYIEEVLADVLKQKPGHLHYGFCVFAAPWYVSRTKTIHVEKKEPVLVSKKFIGSVLDEEVAAFEKEMASQTYSALVGKDLEIIEQNIIQTKINGYETANPYMNKAQNIEVTVFVSLAVKSILEKVEGIVHRSFHIKHLTFHSFSLSVCNSIRDIFPNEYDFMHVDITGEVTELSYVRQGILLETVSFPCGRNTFIRKAADFFATTPEIAYSYIKLFGEGNAEEKISKDIEKAINEAKAEWLTFFDQAIADMSKGIIPSKLFLTLDNETANLFVNYIRDRGIIAPILLDDSVLSQFITHEGSGIDPFIALSSIHFNKMFHL